MAVKKEPMDEFEVLARARLAKTHEEYAAVVEAAKPLRDKIDALQAEHGRIDAELAPLIEDWRPFNLEMARLQNEIGRGSRALGGYSTSDATRAPGETVQ